MRPVTLIVLVSMLAVAGAHAQQPPSARATASAAPSSIRKLSRGEFDALTKDPAKVLVLDVRRPDELTAIGGFPAYLSIQAGDLANELAYIPKDRAIVTGSTSCPAAATPSRTEAAESCETSCSDERPPARIATLIAWGSASGSLRRRQARRRS